MKHIISFLCMAVLLFAATVVNAAEPPHTLTYQGVMYVDDELYDGEGDFKLTIVDSSGRSLWSNDGTSVDGSEPEGFITETLHQGVFSVILGDTSIQGMAPLDDTAIFDTTETVYLKVWTDTGDGFLEFSPMMQITSVVYALNAQLLQGFSPADFFVLNRDQVTRNQISNSAVGADQIADSSVTPEKMTVFSQNDTMFTVGRCQNENVNFRACISGAAIQPGLRYNASAARMEYSNDGNVWNAMSGGGGSGTVNAGAENELSYYAADGTAVSGLATANNGTLVTSPTGVPSISSTLPGAVQGNITAVGTIGAGTWQGNLIADTFLADNLTINGGTINNSIIGGATAAAGTFTSLTAEDTVNLGDATTDTLRIVPPQMLGEFTDTTGPSTGANQGALFVGSDNALYYRAELDGTTTNISAGGAVDSVFGRVGAVTAAADDYTWAQVDKSTSSIADIATRSAGDLSSGNLNVARMPTGGTWSLSSALTIDGTSNINTANIDGGSIDGTNIGSVTPGRGTFTDFTADGTVNLTDATTDLLSIAAPPILGEFTDTTGPSTGANQGALFVGSDNALYYRAELDGATTNISAGGAVDSVFGRVGAVTAAADDYTWAQVDKTTSSIADIATRSAADLSSGNLDVARMPSGGTWNLTTPLTISGTTNMSSSNIDGGTIDNAIIGDVTPQTATFTDVTADNVRANRSLVLEDPSVVGTNTITVDAPDGLASSIGFQLPGNLGTSGQVLTTNGTGPTATLNWTDKTAGGASSALDNLASVAINTALLPGTDNSIDLGSSILEFRDAHIDGTANIDSLAADSADLATGFGNVDIGTTGGTAKLMVQQAAAADAFRVNDQAGDTTPFVIAQDGAVGIGTTTPTGTLQVHGTGVSSNFLENAKSSVVVWDMRNQAAGVGGGLILGGMYSGADITPFAGIRGVKSNSLSSNYSGQLEFFTRLNGDDFWTDDQRMIITNIGEVLIPGGDLTLGKDTVANSGSLTLHDADATDSFTTTISSAADVNADQTYILPAAPGSVDQVLTAIDATGVLGWTDKASTAGVIRADGSVAFTADQSHGDHNITNVGNIRLDSIGADDGTSFSMSNDWTNAGNTIADLGTVTTANIDGGSIDDTDIGNITAAKGAFTDLSSDNDTAVYGGDLSVGQGGVAYAGRVALHDADATNSFTTTLQSNADVPASFTLVLPRDDGAENEVLTTDGVGNLSWSTPSGTGATRQLDNLAGVSINESLILDADATYDLGASARRWQNLYLSRNLSDGTNTMTLAQIVTLNGVQTLANKNLSSPRFSGTPIAAGVTWTDLGTVSTANIDGGTIDNSIIGGTTPVAGTFSDLTADTSLSLEDPLGSGNSITIDAPDGLAAGYTIELPDDDGTPGQVLTTDGSGDTSWTTVGGDSDWSIESTPASFLRARTDYGIATGGAVLYGSNADTHINLGFGINPTTGTSGQNYSYITLSGGYSNIASGDNSTISGGYQNSAAGWRGTVGGGNVNSAGGSHATVAGGNTNSASNTYSAVGGGSGNLASGISAVVGGGQNNTSSNSSSTVAGGNDNTASGLYSTVGGGFGNTASVLNATVSGGSQNTASGAGASVVGGTLNIASGQNATVGNGYGNTAAADYSWVGGREMDLTSAAVRSFVWGYSGSSKTVTDPNVFLVFPALGPDHTSSIGSLGVGVFSPATALHVRGFLGGNVATIDGVTGSCTLAPAAGASWSCSSDETLKDNIVDLDSALENVLALRPVKFDYIPTGEERIGFIAQEVQEVMPDAVDDSGEHLTLAQGMFMPLVVGAIQQQQEQIEELKAVNKSLLKIVCLDHPEADVCAR